MYQKCLAIDEKSLGTEHPEIAKIYNNIGLLLNDEGEYQEAFSVYQKCLAIQEKVLGTEHPSTATNL